MSDIFFVIKVMIVTLVLVFLMQIKIGEDTLENQAIFALRESPFSDQIQELGRGGWTELRKNFSKIAKSLSQSFSDRGGRSNLFNFERSEKHKENEERKAQARKATRASENLEEPTDDESAY